MELGLQAQITPVTWTLSSLSLGYGIFKLLRERTQWQRDLIAKRKEEIELNKMENDKS